VEKSNTSAQGVYFDLHNISDGDIIVTVSGMSLQRTATHCSTLQHIATHCNTLQRTATHCNTLQHAATQCNTLQHTAMHCNTLFRSLQHQQWRYYRHGI